MTDNGEKKLAELQTIQRNNTLQLLRLVAEKDNALLAHADHVRPDDIPVPYRRAWETTLEWGSEGKAFNLDSYSKVNGFGALADFQAVIMDQPRVPPEPKYVKAAAEALQDAARRLRLHDLGGQVQYRALHDSDIEKVEREAGDAILSNAPIIVTLPDRKADTDAVETTVKHYHANPTDIRGMQSDEAFYPVDYTMGGLEQGEYMLVAGRPSMGKSTFVGQYAAGLAANGHGGIIFSLEMDRHTLRRRIVCSRAGVDSMALRRGRLSPLDQAKFYAELKKLMSFPLWIVDRRGLSVRDMEVIARKAQREHGIKWAVIDTLNKVGDIAESDSMYHGMTLASLRASNMAGAESNKPKDELLAVIAVVQMSRDVKQRSDKRPMLTDLRDTGALEQDADKVLSIHRPHYYSKDQADEHKAEIDLLKARDGSLGNTEVYWESAWPGFRRLQKSSVILELTGD